MSGDPSQFALLAQRRFLPLWLCRLANSLNSELLRMGAIFLIGATAAASLGNNSLRREIAIWFVLPALLAAPLGGQLADRFDRRTLIWITQLTGLLTAAVGSYAMLTNNHSALLAAVALAGFQVSIFGPTAGALVRQHLGPHELMAGSGLLVAAQQLAVVVGLPAVLLAASSFEGDAAVIGSVLVLSGLLGALAGACVPESSPPQPGFALAWNPLAAIRGTLLVVLKDRNLFLAVLGVSWFWFTSLVYLIFLPDFGVEVLGVNPAQSPVLILLPVAGVLIGSLLCRPASGQRVELGLVPLGALGMTVGGVAFYFSAPDAATSSFTLWELLEQNAFRWLAADMLLFGIAAGLFVVPLNAYILETAPGGKLGRVLGGTYFYNLLFISLVIGGADWLLAEGLSVHGLILLVTLMHAGVSLYIFLLLPEFLLRLVMWVLVHTIYRVDASGLEKVPPQGPAIIVCNHITYMDALIIGARVRRPIRFVMHKYIFEIPLLSTFFRLAKAIPIVSAKKDPEGLAAAMDQVANELSAGRLVAIFPEGRLTTDGEMGIFRSGIERMVERNPVPVVPMALQGLWGSFFSNDGGPPLTHRPRLNWSRIGLRVGDPVPAESVSAADLQQRVLDLRAGQG
ncbi:MAG: MFS transporter [Gammaproteobacteria bacterium]